MDKHVTGNSLNTLLIDNCMRAVTLLKTFLLKSKSSRKLFRKVIISLSGFRNKKHAE